MVWFWCVLSQVKPEFGTPLHTASCKTLSISDSST